MKKTMIIASALLVSLLCFHGCAKIPESKAEAIQISIQKVDDVHGPDYHLKYDISVREEPKRWIVYFEGKSGILGDHLHVTISKASGKVEFYQGQ